MASSCAEHPQVVGDGSGAAKGSEGAAPTRPSTQKAARHLSSSRVHRVLRSWHPGLMVCPRERQSSLADPGAASGGRATQVVRLAATPRTGTLRVRYEYSTSTTLRVLYGYSTCTRMTGVCVRHREAKSCVRTGMPWHRLARFFDWCILGSGSYTWE